MRDVHERRDYWTLLYATILALTFVGYPVLSSGLGAFDAYARVFSIVYRAFVGFGSLLLIWRLLWRLTPEVRRSAVVVAFCLLWAMMLARFVWDASFVRLPLNLEWTDTFLLMVGAVLVPAVALFEAPSERAFDIARTIILCGAALAGAFMLAAVVRLVVESQSIDALRRVGTDELNPISLGNVAVVLVTVSLLGQPPIRSSSFVVRMINSRVFRILVGVLGGFLVIASASKGPIVALVGVIAVAQIARILRTGTFREMVLALAQFALVLAALAILAFILGVFFNVRVIDRFVNFAVDTSTSDRVGMAVRALQQFEGSPWIGSGLVETQARFYPHNSIIEALMTMGIPGLCALLVVLWAGLRACVRVLYTRHAWVMLLCVQFQIIMLFSGSIFISAEFWVSLTAVLALDRLLTDRASTVSAPVVTPLVLGARPQPHGP